NPAAAPAPPAAASGRSSAQAPASATAAAVRNSPQADASPLVAGIAAAGRTDGTRPASGAGRKTDPGADELQVARAKFDAGLFDQTLVDLQGTVARKSSRPSSPAAHL